MKPQGVTAFEALTARFMASNRTKPVKWHWKVKGVAVCGAKTGSLTVICNDVTCLRCMKETAKAWLAVIRRGRNLDADQ